MATNSYAPLGPRGTLLWPDLSRLELGEVERAQEVHTSRGVEHDNELNGRGRRGPHLT
jgi:hypothetical protein